MAGFNSKKTRRALSLPSPEKSGQKNIKNNGRQGMPCLYQNPSNIHLI
jgi:hypothetical protein